jgi:hypothetical protein
MASGDARPVPQKNVAYRLTVPVLDADGDPVGSAAGLDSEVSKDGGAFADCTNEWTEIGTSGIGYLDLTSTEMNADTVVVRVQSSSTGAKTTVVVLYPEEAGDIRVNATQLNGTGLTGRDIGASVLLSVGTGAGQVNLSSGKVPATLSSADVTGNVAADLQTIKTQTVTCAGGVTVPAATLASTTNITAGTVTTATNVTTVNGLAAGVITAAAVATGAIDADALAADAVAEIQSGLATAAALTAVHYAALNGGG